MLYSFSLSPLFSISPVVVFMADYYGLSREKKDIKAEKRGEINVGTRSILYLGSFDIKIQILRSSLRSLLQDNPEIVSDFHGNYAVC